MCYQVCMETCTSIKCSVNGGSLADAQGTYGNMEGQLLPVSLK